MEGEGASSSENFIQYSSLTYKWETFSMFAIIALFLKCGTDRFSSFDRKGFV